MLSIINCYVKLKKGAHLDDDDFQNLQRQSIKDFQYASLLVLLLHRAPNKCEIDLIKYILNIYPQLLSYINLIDTRKLIELGMQSPTAISASMSLCFDVMKATKQQCGIGNKLITTVINLFVEDKVDLNFMAVWLMLIYLHGLNDEDLASLTAAMCATGSIYDYRNHIDLDRAKLVRRYPTGALSEKAALILPSLLSLAAAEYNIKSPFLVAKSLSFTGGTWDKLHAINGFSFPDPGDETIHALKQCAVAMVVTKGNANPADRKLYEFRSMTGTVDSLPLIAASIASKQLSFPVDYLLLDVRYGSGSFCDRKSMAMQLAATIQWLLKNSGIHVDVNFQDTQFPIGMCIGNSCEVAEAIAIMQPNFLETMPWQPMKRQKDLVIHFFAQIMRSVTPNMDRNFWIKRAHEYFDSGNVLQAFTNILIAHGVANTYAKSLVGNAFDILVHSRTHKMPVYAKQSGVLVALEQKVLGNIVNFQVNNVKCEIILHKYQGEWVACGDRLCELIFSGSDAHYEQARVEMVRACFMIR